MTRVPRAGVLAVIGLAACTVALETAATIRFQSPFPPFTAVLNSPLTDLHDAGGVLAGLRRLTADLAWIQTLQYYGKAEEGLSEFEAENGVGHYPRFLAYCERVARLDPSFTYVYYYGGAALGWNLGRLDEAESLLRLGIQNNPQEWRLPQYMAALAYQKNHDPKQLVQFLEGYISQPECPNLLRSLLANLYAKNHQYRDAIRVWVRIAETGEPGYAQRAMAKIRELAILDRKMGL